MSLELCNGVLQIALQSVHTDVLRLPTKSRASSTATSAAQSVSAFHQAPTGTKRSALATTTGRPRKATPSAPKGILVIHLQEL